MKVPPNSQTPDVTFSKDGKVMATVRATVVTEGQKKSSTEIDSVAEGNAQVVKEIRPADGTKRLASGRPACTAPQTQHNNAAGISR